MPSRKRLYSEKCGGSHYLTSPSYISVLYAKIYDDSQRPTIRLVSLHTEIMYDFGFALYLSIFDLVVLYIVTTIYHRNTELHQLRKYDQIPRNKSCLRM